MSINCLKDRGVEKMFHSLGPGVILVVLQCTHLAYPQWLKHLGQHCLTLTSSSGTSWLTVEHLGQDCLTYQKLWAQPWPADSLERERSPTDLACWFTRERERSPTDLACWLTRVREVPQIWPADSLERERERVPQIWPADSLQREKSHSPGLTHWRERSPHISGLLTH